MASSAMEAQIKLGPVFIKVGGENQVDLFEAIASASEVFGHESCGKCGCDDTVFVCRHVSKGKKDFAFHERQCRNPECRAVLSYGQKADGSKTLFPKRKLAANGQPDSQGGTYGSHRGWSTYRGPAREEEEGEEASPSSSIQKGGRR